MKNIDNLVDKIKESPFSTEGDRLLALEFLNEALTKCRCDVDRTSLKKAFQLTLSKVEVFSSFPFDQ
jgi:hypothetical protein